MSLPKPCLHHGCAATVRNGSWCPVHAPPQPTTAERGYGGSWARTSARIIQRDGGVCQLRLSGCTVRATTTDHVVPKLHGGSDEDGNLVAACRHCNSSKGGRVRHLPRVPSRDSGPSLG